MLFRSTPNFMVYGELGRTPLEVNVKLRMVCFWNKLISNENKLSSILLRLALNLQNNTNHSFKWINYITSIFNETGFSYVFDNKLQMPDSFYKGVLKQRLIDQFIQKWFTDIANSSRGQYYSIFKTEFGFEKYLLNLSEQFRIPITKLRTSNIKFPIETGRWHNIPKEERLCNLCSESIGDEFHYIFLCNNATIVNLRNKYIPHYYCTNPSIYKMKGFLSLCHQDVPTGFIGFSCKTYSTSVTNIHI